MTTDMNREVVSVGLDFRPIPVNLGDGTIWQFDPDPAPALFNRLTISVKALGPVGKAMADANAEENGEFDRALSNLKDALGALLVDEDQQKKWSKRTYGFRALNALVGALMDELTGFTQESPSKSGKG